MKRFAIRFPLKVPVLVLLSAMTLGGCQTAGQLHQSSSKGMGALSCADISAAFAAYDADRQSVGALETLATTMNLDLKAMGGTSVESAQNIFAQAKSAANIALAVQGCQSL